MFTVTCQRMVRKSNQIHKARAIFPRHNYLVLEKDFAALRRYEIHRRAYSKGSIRDPNS